MQDSKIKEISKRPLVLAIGGHDPCAGAGINQDLYAIQKMNAWGHSLITCLTAQNDQEFKSLHWVEKEALEALEVLLNRFEYKVIKFGLIPSAEFAFKVIDLIEKRQGEKPLYIWDPILSASAGFKIHEDNGLESWIELIKRVDLFTPNLPEAKSFFGEEIYTKLLQVNAHTHVLLKGGHKEGGFAEDELWQKNMCQRFSHPKVPNEKRGTGCALASGIAAGMANKLSWAESLKNSKKNLLDYMLSDKNKLGVWNG